MLTYDGAGSAWSWAYLGTGPARGGAYLGTGSARDWAYLGTGPARGWAYEEFDIALLNRGKCLGLLHVDLISGTLLVRLKRGSRRWF
jgi:hypothetical protein